MLLIGGGLVGIIQSSDVLFQGPGVRGGQRGSPTHRAQCTTQESYVAQDLLADMEMVRVRGGTIASQDKVCHDWIIIIFSRQCDLNSAS